jgi:hypothetical protein
VLIEVPFDAKSPTAATGNDDTEPVRAALAALCDAMTRDVVMYTAADVQVRTTIALSNSDIVSHSHRPLVSLACSS